MLRVTAIILAIFVSNVAFAQTATLEQKMKLLAGVENRNDINYGGTAGTIRILTNQGYLDPTKPMDVKEAAQKWLSDNAAKSPQ